MEENAMDVEVGDTVVNKNSGKKFTVGKIEQDSMGRIEFYNTKDKHICTCGKKVKFLVY